MNAQGDAAPGGPKGRGLGLAVALLVVGLVVGLGIGYLVAPSPQPPPAPQDILETSGSVVHLSVLAGPPTDMFSFSVGGLKNPTVSVQRGANVTVHFSNIDPDMPHSFVVTSDAPPYGAEPGEAAFPGAETPMAHMGQMPGENGTASFTASTAGTYYYVCHVSGHAASGMYGTFEVRT